MVLCRLLYWFFALRHCTSTPNAGDLFSSVQRLLAISSSNATHCIVPPCLQPVLPGLAAPLPRHQPCKSLQERQKQLLLPLAPRVTFGSPPCPLVSSHVKSSFAKQAQLCREKHHAKARCSPARGCQPAPQGERWETGNLHLRIHQK